MSRCGYCDHIHMHRRTACMFPSEEQYVREPIALVYVPDLSYPMQISCVDLKLTVPIFITTRFSRWKWNHASNLTTYNQLLVSTVIELRLLKIEFFNLSPLLPFKWAEAGRKQEGNIWTASYYIRDLVSWWLFNFIRHCHSSNVVSSWENAVQPP